MLHEQEKRLIEENMHVVEIVVKSLMARFNIPRNEFDDYCQNAYLILCNKIHKFDGTTKFSTFADIVLTNAFIDKYRRDKARNPETVSIDFVPDKGEAENIVCLADYLATDINAENEILSKITHDMIKKYIKAAKKKCTAHTTIKGFEVLELKIEGYSGAEIADMFNVPSNSLRSWISRAKKILVNEHEFIELCR